MEKVKKQFKGFIFLSSILLSLSAVSLLFKVDLNVASAWSGTQTPDYATNYYQSSEGKVKDELLSSLRSYNRPNSPSYDWSRYEKADEAENLSDSIRCLYTRLTMKKNSHVGSYSLDTWNREHIYPQGRFPASDKDNHNIYACEGQINNYRGSLSFGEVAHTSSNRQEVHGYLTDCYKSGGLFEPCDEAKGEVARAVMYCAVYYEYSITSIFDDVETCLRWHYEIDPVDDRDIYRNNIVHDLQGNRNPFVDHPEYANAIWGDGTIIPEDPYIDMTTSLGLEVGDIKNLDATIKNGSGVISYSTLDASIATVDELGNVKGIKKGTTTIIASANIEGQNIEARCQINVNDPIILTGLTMNKETATINVNKTLQLSVTPIPSNANSDVNWESSNEAVAVVDENGLVKGLKVGTATITATSVKFNNIKATCTIEIIAAPVNDGFNKVCEDLIDWSGTYLIGYQEGNNVKIFDISKGGDANNFVVASINENTIEFEPYFSYSFEIIKNSNTYEIKYQDKWLSNSSKTPTLNGEVKTHTIEFLNENDIKVKNSSSNYSLQYNASANMFRYYESTQKPIQLFKLEQSLTPTNPKNAEEFATKFLTNLTCDGGITKPSKSVWNELKEDFNKLDETEKSILRNEDFSNNESNICKAMERYDYIVLKYGESEYTNFIGRNLDVNNTNLYLQVAQSNVFIFMIAMVSIISITTIIYFGLRKKHIRK